MRKNIYTVVVATMLIVVVIGLSSCGSNETNVADKPLIGEFKTQQLNGEAATSEIFRESKLTMVNVWATFCTPCIDEMPDLGEISREYKTEDFQIVGLVSDIISPKDVKAMEIVSETKADYVHLVADKTIRQNFMNDVQFVPTTVFLNSEGKQVGETYTGSKSKEAWIEIIKEMQEIVNESK